jgi:peroxiredoxin
MSALLLAAGACAHEPHAAAPPPAPPPSSASHALGMSLTPFRRPTVQGGFFDTAQVAGRVLVVDFFADYCRPCQRTLPQVEALHRAHPELAIVGVALDPDGAAVRRTIARHGLTFPIVHDAALALAGRFRVNTLPAAFVIDESGRVSWAAGPDQPEDALARAAMTFAAERRHE